MGNRGTKKGDGFVFKMLEELLYIGFVLLGLYLAFLIRFNMNPPYRFMQSFFGNIPCIILASIVVFDIYNVVSTLKKSLFENAVVIAVSLFLINMITMAVVFLSKGSAFPKNVFVIGFAIQFSIIFIAKTIILNAIKLGRVEKNILVIALGDEVEYITKKILLDKHNLDSIKYICDKVNRNVYELIDYVDKVYIGSTIVNGDRLDIVNYCSEKGKIVYLIPNLFEISLADSKIGQVGDILVFKLENLRLTHEQKFMKRALDIITSFVGLIITLPILLVVSLSIKLYDGGSIFYKQERVTENGKTFDLYKFRTMVVDAEKYTGPILAMEEDPRITPLGGFLRASRIDELPQLFNVLQGDMSVVGPRPERPFFVEQFNEEIDEFKYRVFVKAGITGLAQVLGNYSTVPKTKAKYDLLYIKNYSLLLDIKIILNTVKIIFLRDSSRGIAKDKKLDEVFGELGLSVCDELGITKVEWN